MLAPHMTLDDLENFSVPPSATETEKDLLLCIASTALPELIRRLKRLREAWPLERFDDNDFCVRIDETGIGWEELRDAIYGEL